jgi:hypothetical protein
MSEKTPAAPKSAAAETPAVVAPGAVAVPGAVPVVPPRRHPGHRGADVRDTVAEMAAKAQEISMEAGSKMAAAMKEVIGAAAGLSAFAIESARDLVQYMVRRGQMTQEEADKLIREAEEAWSKMNKGKKLPARDETKPEPTKSVVGSVIAKVMAAAKPKPAAKPAPAKAKAPAKPVAKKPAPKKPVVKKAVPKKK